MFIVVGTFFLCSLGESMLAVALLLIVFFMIEGMSKVIFALTVRPFPNWGWVLLGGTVGILLSPIPWASIPVTAVWLLGLLFGIGLISEGPALGHSAWRGRKS